MKKYFIYFMALLMVISTLMSSVSRADLFSLEPKRASEGLCTFFGGVLGAVVGHQIGHSDLARILGGLLGGTVGYQICKDLNDVRKQTFLGLLDKNSGIPAHAPQSLELDQPEHPFYGVLKVEQVGERRHDGARCLLTNTSVYRRAFAGQQTHGSDELMGNTGRFWICKNEQTGQWELDRNSRIDPIRTRTVIPGPGDSNGGVVSGPVYTQHEIDTWSEVNFEKYLVTAPIAENTVTRESGITIRIINRIGERGFFAGAVRNQDGQLAVKMSHKEFGFMANSVAVQCDVVYPKMAGRPFCRSAEVRNLNFNNQRINGRVQYIFPNREVVISDTRLGEVIVPLSVLTR